MNKNILLRALKKIIEIRIVENMIAKVFKKNKIYSFASIGNDPQDLKFNGEQTNLEIGNDNKIREYSNEIDILNGKMTTLNVTIINSRSVAEDVVFYKDQGINGLQHYTGKLSVTRGDIDDADIIVTGKSLVHSAALTSIAFTKSFLGQGGKYIVAIALTLFAFSTAVAWSYYGNRCVVYLLGIKAILPFRLVYLTGFFLASFADTTIIWTIAAITVVFSTLPNLLCMLMMRKEVKMMVNDYINKIK